MDLIRRKRYEEIDILKGFAIIMVLLGHAVIRYPIDLHNVPVTKAIYDWVETTHMPLFFCVSGFCFSVGTSTNDLKVYYSKKIKRILIPYLIFNCVDLIPRFLLPSFVNRPRSIGESFREIIFYGGEYWFLYSLFFVFLFFPAFDRILRNRRYLQILFLIFCVALKFVPGLPNVFLIKRTSYHFLYFTFGYIIKQNFSFEEIKESLLSKKYFSLFCVILFLIVMTLLIPIYVIDYNQVFGIVLAFCGICTSLIVSVFFPRNRTRNQVIEFGKYSLQLYLLNGFTLVLARVIIVSILDCSNAIIIVLFNLSVTLWIGYLITIYILDRTRFLRLISGLI